MHPLLTSVLFAGCIWSLIALRADQNARQALEDWEKLAARENPPDILSLAARVRTGATKGDNAVIERLLAIVRNESQAAVSQAQALIVACELAGDEGGQAIVGTIEAVRANYRPDPTCIDRTECDQGFIRLEVLSRSFLTQCAVPLLAVLENHERVLAFAEEYCSSGLRFDDAYVACKRLIMECDVPYELRERTIITLIRRLSTVAGEELFDLLKPSAFPALRRLVREGSPEGIHWKAAHALAYLGDEEIAPYFEKLSTELKARNDHSERHVDSFLWLIKAKHTPALLLERIENASNSTCMYSALWALKRAKQVGVYSGEIRAAVLTFARKASEARDRKILRSLAHAASDMGIISSTDLAEMGVAP